jgi:hypothetical protein
MAWPIGGLARPAKATRAERPRGNPRGRRWFGGGGGTLGFPRGRRLPTTSTTYIKPPGPLGSFIPSLFLSSS